MAQELEVTALSSDPQQNKWNTNLSKHNLV